MLRVSVGNGSRKAEGGADARKQRMVHHGQAEKPGWMRAHDGPIEHNEQSARPDERDEEREDAEVPKLVWIDAGKVCGAHEKAEGKQNAERGQHAIGWNNEWTDVEEDGMHVREGYLLRQESRKPTHWAVRDALVNPS